MRSFVSPWVTIRYLSPGSGRVWYIYVYIVCVQSNACAQAARAGRRWCAVNDPNDQAILWFEFTKHNDEWMTLICSNEPSSLASPYTPINAMLRQKNNICIYLRRARCDAGQMRRLYAKTCTKYQRKILNNSLSINFKLKNRSYIPAASAITHPSMPICHHNSILHVHILDLHTASVNSSSIESTAILGCYLGRRMPCFPHRKFQNEPSELMRVWVHSIVALSKRLNNNIRKHRCDPTTTNAARTTNCVHQFTAVSGLIAL